MTKRSQRRPPRHLERAQVGCIWGLISIFDFRHSRSTRRLLSDRKQAVGAGRSNAQKLLLSWTEKCEHILDSDENKMPMADAAKTSVKDLMEVEMFNEQSSMNQATDSEEQLEQISSKCFSNAKNKRRNRSCDKSSNTKIPESEAEGCSPENCREQKPSADLDIERIMEELSEISRSNIDGCSKNDINGDLDVPSIEAVTVIKLVLEEKLSNSKRFGEEGNAVCPKDFVDALQALSLNKGMFLKLLQDPNSALVKHIRNFEDAQMDKDQICSSSPGSNLSAEKLVNSSSGEFSSRRYRSFFRRRSKSLDSFPLGGDKDSQSPHVVQKPGPTGARSPETDIAISNSQLQACYIGNKVQNYRNTSHFSFTEIKRKLKHAMGKERPGISPDRMILKLPPKHQNSSNSNRSAVGETFSWSSPNRNHFYSERFAIRSPKSEQICKTKEKDSVMANETSQHPQPGESGIYIEAKKHLLEMLARGDENAEPVAAQFPKSLGRILSFPEYNGSPCSSPRKHDDSIFITTQTRLSPHSTVRPNQNGHFHENHSNHQIPRSQNLDSQSCISGLVSEESIQPHDMNANSPIRNDLECLDKDQSFTRCTIVPQETEEMMEPKLQQEETTVDITSGSCRTSYSGDSDKGSTREVENEGRASEFLQESSTCFKADLCGEDDILSSLLGSPSHPPASLEVKDSGHENGKEQPSPISILEPLFTDDDISPASSISQPVEKEIQPRHINFEEQCCSNEQGICVGISLEGEESAFEYVEAVLLGSGLNWDEFLLRWLSLDEILDLSLFEEVELFSSRPHYDQKLLFDCANVSLKDVCDSYFGCFTGIPQGKPNFRAIPKGMDLIYEIWKGIEGHLYQHPQQPHSLDQLVRIDLERSGKWLNLQSDIGLTGFGMEEAIFNEFVDDLVNSFIEDLSEFKFAMPQPESNAIEAGTS